MLQNRIRLALACLLVGCVPRGGGLVEEKIEQQHDIEPNATIRIENADGSILVYGANAPELMLFGAKRAYSRERLKQIDIRVSVQPGVVSIETVFPPRPKWGVSDRSGTVDYVLVVPQTATIAHMKLANGELLMKDMRGGPLQAELGNGLCFIENCFCDVRVAVQRGGINVHYGWWEPGKFSLETKINHGGTLVGLPSAASFRLLAETSRGQIVNGFAGQPVRAAGARRGTVDVVGAAPNAEINLHASAGNIQIAKIYP